MCKPSLLKLLLPPLRLNQQPEVLLELRVQTSSLMLVQAVLIQWLECSVEWEAWVVCQVWEWECPEWVAQVAQEACLILSKCNR